MRTERVVARLAWPLLASGGFALTALGIARGWPGELTIAVVYVALALAVGAAERAWPHEPRWNQSDGEVRHDVVFTLFGSGLTGAVLQGVLVAALAGAAIRLSRAAGSLWPAHWPRLAQIGFTVALADLGAYWAHRLCHERPVLWRFHAIHHSVRRLWWLNTGRIHPVDVALTFVLSTPLLILLGAPAEMMTWLASATTVVGLLSHCNVAMRCGWLDRVFNTPSVHRWHHSPERRESDRNYGENTMLWDLLFGTYALPARRSPRAVGTPTPVPASIAGQMLAPLIGAERWERLRRARLGVRAPN